MEPTNNNITIKDLSTTFWTGSVCNTSPMIKVKEEFAKVVCYLFSVPLPHPEYDGTYRFTVKDVEAVERQMDGVDMHSLEYGYISLDTLLLLSNSPRFPYTLHTNTASLKGSVPAQWEVFYRFILKRDIIIPRPTTKEI